LTDFDSIDSRHRPSQLECCLMTRIVVRAYSRIEASTNRWYSVVLYMSCQFCSNVPCSESHVSELADRQLQNRSVRSACKIKFKVVCD